MPIIINNQKFSLHHKESLNKIIEELKKLPEPEVIPIHQYTVQQKETVLCLQKEIAYVDELNPASDIRYLGTKNIFSCILVYMYTETDHAVVHVDHTKPVNFMDILSRFNYRNAVKVSLVGGTPSQDSANNLKNIIEELLLVSEKLKIDVILENQKLMSRNIFSSDDRYSFIYDKIIEKANRLSLKYFAKPINVDLFTNRTIKDLKERSVGMSIKLQTIAAALSDIVELYKSSNKTKTEMLKKLFKQIIQTESDLNKFVDLMFSKEGFQLLNMGYENMKIYRDSKLCHFVFDIITKKITTISAHIPTPNESLRNVVCLDPYQEKKYFVSYDGQKSTYVMPVLSQKFHKSCLELKPIIMQEYLDENDFNRVLTTLKTNDHIPTLNELAGYIKRSMEEKPNTHHPLTKVTFFETGKKISDMYNSHAITTSNVTKLNELTGLQFSAKMRVYPSYTVDAILTCQSEIQAKEIMEKIQEKNITVKLMKFTGDVFCVCVPAINVEHYANQIVNAHP